MGGAYRARSVLDAMLGFFGFLGVGFSLGSCIRRQFTNSMQ